jgi:GT2 family glycosyltransferase
MESTLPNVDAVIVTRDRAELLLAALRSVERAFETAKASGEIVVVDNDSSDGSAERVARELPAVRWIQLDRNFGFATAVNHGIRAASGEWLLLLNNDATVDEHALRRALDRSIPDDVGTIALQMRFADRPDIVNSAGIGVDVLGIAYDRFLGEPVAGPASAPAEVFGGCAGAALYRRAMLDDIGGFDPGYFVYLEDVDVAWRAQMAGWRTLYVPEAVALHAHSTTAKHGSSFKYFHVGRSRIRLLARNADSRQLRRHGLQMLVYDLGYVAFVAARDRTLAPLRGRLSGLREWRSARAGTVESRRPVELDRRLGFAAALRRRRAWATGAGAPRAT